MFRLICLNNVIKRYIYTENIFNPSCKSAEGSQDAYFAIRERVNALFVVEGLSVYENFVRTLNAVTAKYALLTKPKVGSGTMKFTFNLSNRSSTMKSSFHKFTAALFAACLFILFACSSDSPSGGGDNPPSSGDYCGGASYTPSSQFCHNDAIYQNCGDYSYRPNQQFCFNNKIYGKCDNKDYNPINEFCYDDAIRQKCDGNEYFPPNEFCFNNTVYKKCSVSYTGEEYNPTTHACLTDIDGIKLYKVVTIGTQTWMAENLNIRMIGSSKCYDNNSAKCEEYGRLYNWAAAMGLPASCNTNSCSSQISAKHKGICPNGWHIPTEAEWDILTNYAGGESNAGKKLKARSGWPASGNGTDDYGFSALPGGEGVSDGSFGYAGSSGYWWTANEDYIASAYSRSMSANNDIPSYWNDNDKSLLMSVRCLKDN